MAVPERSNDTKRGRLASVPGGEIVALSALYESTQAIGIRASLEETLEEVLNQAEEPVEIEETSGGREAPRLGVNLSGFEGEEIVPSA